MKKILLATLGFILLCGVTLFTLTGAPTTIHKDLGSGSGGTTGTVHYDRHDFPCADGVKEKTYCIEGGNQNAIRSIVISFFLLYN